MGPQLGFLFFIVRLGIDFLGDCLIPLALLINTCFRDYVLYVPGFLSES